MTDKDVVESIMGRWHSRFLDRVGIGRATKSTDYVAWWLSHEFRSARLEVRRFLNRPQNQECRRTNPEE